MSAIGNEEDHTEKNRFLEWFDHKNYLIPQLNWLLEAISKKSFGPISALGTRSKSSIRLRFQLRRTSILRFVGLRLLSTKLLKKTRNPVFTLAGELETKSFF